MYKDFLETPRSIVNVSYLQNAVTTVFKREQDLEKIGKLPTLL